MGPIRATLDHGSRCRSSWQDPVPPVNHESIGPQAVASLKARILSTGLSISQSVYTAWLAAAWFRGTDKRGGANGGRIRSLPQTEWEVNSRAC